jgi:outer membrane protease
MKISCFFAFSILLVSGLAANDHNFSIGGSFGLLNGRAEEIVYRDSKTKNKLSQLLWDFKPLVYAGLDVHYSWQKPENKWGLFANGSSKFGFSGETGIMEDRDWVVDNYPNFLTHYSVHENKTKAAILMDFGIGASFVIFRDFLLKAYISYHYMHWAWTASGGSLLYPTGHINENDEPQGDHFPLRSIDVGTYEQNWYIVSPAIAFYGEFNRFFDIEISLQATPLIWCITKDHHILRHLVITENTFGGFFIEPSLLFSFKPIDHFVLSFSFQYRNISGTRGNGVYKYAGDPPFTYRNGVGAGYAAYDIGIIFKYRL